MLTENIMKKDNTKETEKILKTLMKKYKNY